MIAVKRVSSAILCTLMLLFATRVARAQKPVVPSRVVEEVDDSRTVQRKGNIHPLARPEFDHGAVAESQPMTRMLLLLQRSAEQEAALQQLLEAQQTKGSSSYHAWLTPEQFGAQFGPSDADLQKVTDWLTRQGFAISKVSKGRTTIEFNGTVAQVRNAFQTDIHKFSVNGKEHFANVSDPAIPEALSPVVRGVVSLHNFPKKASVHHVGNFRQNMATGEISPLFTFTDVNGTFFGVGPQDFATIYDVPASATGAGQAIAVVGRSNINLQDVRDFRSMFGLAPKEAQVILNGPDPGLVDGDEGESDLDVEWAGAVAPAADVILVSTLTTQTDGSDGVDASALYIVDNNIAPILSESYGSCEASLGTNGNAFYSSLWQQAAAEGITVVVAAGDNGSAGCDDQNSVASAAQGLGISGIASTPFNIAMGGTDFDYSAGISTYWNQTAGIVSSALKYIPEVPWNDSCAATGITGCNSVTSTSSTLNIVAGSGGSSTVYTPANTNTALRKPKWQTGGDANRDIPDVSLFSGDGGNPVAGTFYIVCQSDQNTAGSTGCNLTNFTTTSPFHDFQGVGGTSAATPTFAGIMAMVIAAHGRQGVANYELYKLASTAGILHDVTTGNISVPCAGGATSCSKTTSGGFGILTTAAGGSTIAYAAGPGYDLATGLGTVDVKNLLASWTNFSFSGTTVTLNTPSPSSFTVNSSVTISGSVAKTSGTGTPSGFVILENSTTHAAIDTFNLDSSGNFNSTTNFLPGGSYSVLAHYGGDGTFASSDSPTKPVTAGKQASQAIVNWVDSNGTLSTTAQSVAYGSPYILRIDVTNSTGTSCQNSTTPYVCPTGQISLFQNTGVPLTDFPNAHTPNATNVAFLNDRGFAEDQPIQLSVGSYSITATYPGDNSYTGPVTSNALSVTITKAATTTNVASNLTSITSGTSVTLTAMISTQSNGAGPTGLVTFTNGTASLGTGTCTPSAASASAAASCTATLTTAISALYPVPQKQPRTPLLPCVLFALALAIFLALIRWMPQHRRRAYAYAGLIVLALLATAIVGCGGGGGSSGGGGRTVTLNASYPGDTNYSSSSGSTSITVH